MRCEEGWYACSNLFKHLRIRVIFLGNLLGALVLDRSVLVEVCSGQSKNQHVRIFGISQTLILTLFLTV